MYGSRTVSVVYPAYNEAQNIRSAIEDFFVAGVVDEVVVVDNNSRDRTAEEASQTRARVVHEPAQGYGHALRRGLREAAGDLVILAEPDGTFVGRDVTKLLAYADDFDMVCGTRTTRELLWEQANMVGFLRVGNLAVAKLIQFLYDGPSLSDCGCTLRLIHRAAVERIAGDLSVGGSHFLPEMVNVGLKRGLRVIEIPVNYRYDWKTGEIIDRRHRLSGRIAKGKILGVPFTAAHPQRRQFCWKPSARAPHRTRSSPPQLISSSHWHRWWRRNCTICRFPLVAVAEADFVKLQTGAWVTLEQDGKILIGNRLVE